MKKLYILILLFFVNTSYAKLCYGNGKNYKIESSLNEKTIELFSNSYLELWSDTEYQITDYFDDNGFSNNTLDIVNSKHQENDSRFFLIKLLYPKNNKIKYKINISLYDDTIKEIQGVYNLKLTLILKNIKNPSNNIRLNLIFNRDISDNCRAK